MRALPGVRALPGARPIARDLTHSCRSAPLKRLTTRSHSRQGRLRSASGVRSSAASTSHGAIARRALRGLAGVAAGIAVFGCASHTVRVLDATAPRQLVEVDEDLLLDVGVAVFDANVPDAYDEQLERNITREVRRAEANYMAFVAKDLLQSTGNWGAVRVVPRATDAVEVTLSGVIEHSDGERLVLRTQARDARGAVWFDNTYEALASKFAYRDDIAPNVDPFQSVYRRVADDMIAYRQTLSDEDVRAIRATAEMKFARDFAPDAFAGHLSEPEPGVFQVRRLPAEDDPMLGRVRKVREREYLFIDTLDGYFEEFHARMRPTYQSWRQATYTEAIAYRNERAKARRQALAGAAGIAAGALAQTSGHKRTRWGGAVSVIGGAQLVRKAVGRHARAAVHAEALRELGASAEAEIAPHTIELENRSLRLQGTVDDQYEELRDILRQVYFEELGVVEERADALLEKRLADRGDAAG